MSTSLRIDDDTRLSRVRQAIALVDRVHGDGDLPGVDVIAASRASEEEGYYYGRDSLESGGAGEYMIGVQPQGTTPRLTTAHEVGHLLDHKGMGSGPGWSSEENLEELSTWRQAIDSSKQTQRLRALAADFESRNAPEFAEAIRGYLLQPREQFARSYAQWLAVRAGDQDLRDELQYAQAFENEDDRHLRGYWTDEDFSAISQSLDDLMKELGWRT